MSRTRIIESEVATATAVGTATSISSATVVRLHNDTGAIVTVGVATVVNAATSRTFTLPANSIEFLDKYPTEVIWTSAAIKAAKVGYTG